MSSTNIEQGCWLLAQALATIFPALDSAHARRIGLDELITRIPDDFQKIQEFYARYVELIRTGRVLHSCSTTLILVPSCLNWI